MNAVIADVKVVQAELRNTKMELQNAEKMMRYAEPDFVESQFLLIESLKSKLNALIKAAKKTD